MILDKIENSGIYKCIDTRLSKAFDFLQTTDLSTLSLGKHIIDGDKLYAVVFEYETQPQGDKSLESHIKYIDVQYMIEGTEQIGITTLKDQKSTKEYDHENDYMLFDESFDQITFKKGMFAVFFPDDLHLPGLDAGMNSKVKKIVVKVML